MYTVGGCGAWSMTTTNARDEGDSGLSFLRDNVPRTI